MGEPTNGDPKNSSSAGGGEPTRRGTRRRRRTILNLGMPFVQMDDFLNQSEDAVALGYRVLEQTVEEIKEGYKQAVAFNLKQRQWDGKGPAPAIPWEELVDRVQGFQNIALDAVKDGTAIFFDSIRSGTDSMKTAAKTWEQTRSDVEAKPVLAGPVFGDLIEITVTAGAVHQPPARYPIRHRGLTRLRIDAVMDPPLKELSPIDTSGRASHAGILDVHKVSFEPASASSSEECSVLTIDLGAIKATQKPARYDGLIRASNFELLIARLRVHVVASPARPTGATPAKRRPPTRTSPRAAATERARAATKTK